MILFAAAEIPRILLICSEIRILKLIVRINLPSRERHMPHATSFSLFRRRRRPVEDICLMEPGQPFGRALFVVVDGQ